METMIKTEKQNSRMQSTLDEQQPLMKILSEYEGVNKGLTALVDSYEKEHGELRLECTTLIEENTKLRSQLKKVLNNDQDTSSDGEIGNLKQQLVLATQEKEAALELWKLAVGEVSNLEKILKIFQEQKSDSGYGSVNSRIEKARALSAAETHLVEARAQVAKERLLKAEIESKFSREQEAHRSTSQQLEITSRQLQILEEERSKFMQSQQMDYKQLKDLTIEKEELQRAYNLHKSRLSQALANVDDGRKRVAEALALVDSACISRDQAAAGEAKAKEEVVRLQNALKELTEEATLKVKREVEQIKQQCNTRIQTVLVDMKKIQEECAEQRSLAERGMKGQKHAEEALERRSQELRSVQARLLPLENRMASIQSQLADAERRARSAECSAENLQHELADEKESRKREEAGMENKNKSLEMQIAAVNADMDELRRRAQEVAQDMSSREKQICAKYQALEKNSVTTITELHQIISAHQAVNEKCHTEMKVMAERFSSRLKELREELVRLRSERDEAHKQLHVLRTQPRCGSSKEKGKLRPKSLFLDC